MSNENIQNVYDLPRSNEKSFKEVLNEHFRLFPEKKPGELAKFVGVNARSVSAWRAGRAEPRPGKLQAVADFFGVHISVFLPPPGPAKDYTAEEKRIHWENEMYGKFLKFKGSKEEFSSREGIESVKELDAIIRTVKERFGIDVLEKRLTVEPDERDSLSKPKVKGESEKGAA